MISAVDSSVLLDVLCANPAHAEGSENLLRRCLGEPQLVVCECVVAEIRPALSEEDFPDFLADWGIGFVPSTLESARLAGEYFATYLARGGSAARVVPDFLIGAHAQVHADRLLARDRGYLRDYFTRLTVLDS